MAEADLPYHLLGVYISPSSGEDLKK